MQTVTNAELSDSIAKLIKAVGVMSYKTIAVLTVLAKRGLLERRT